MRGTEDLLAEQKSPFGRKRKRKLRGRAQPYRPYGREPGPTLDAMLKGAPRFLPNPQDAKRAAQKRVRTVPVGRGTVQRRQRRRNPRRYLI